MKKYDKRNRLNWIEKLIERWRLVSEIVDMELEVEKRKKATKGNLLEFKRSGVPVIEINIEFKKKELAKLNNGSK